MSDTPEGTGWWIASDGKWYPPEQHPQGQPAETEPAAAESPAEQGGGEAQPAGGGGSNNYLALAILAAVVIAAVIGLVVLLDRGDDESVTSEATATATPTAEESATPEATDEPTVAPATEVIAEPVSSLGEDPFTPPIVPGAPGGPEPSANTEDPEVDEADVDDVLETLNPPEGEPSEVDATGIELPPQEPGQATNVGGDAPGLYGGTNVLDVCDKPALIDFLTSNPEKASAWAAVQGLTAAQIPGYIDSLTDVVLRVDTRVTNHGFSNGAAYPIDSILQAGTAVLIDDFGVPRVRCYCGNPLLPARPLAPAPTVTGTPWPGIDVDQTIVITQVTQITVIQINNIHGGGPIYRPPGAPITEITTPTPTPTATPSPTPTATPTPSEVPGSRFTGVWLGSVSDGEVTLPFEIEVFSDGSAEIFMDVSITDEGVTARLVGTGPIEIDEVTGDFSGSIMVSVSDAEFFADVLVDVWGSFETGQVTMCGEEDSDCVSGTIQRA